MQKIHKLHFDLDLKYSRRAGYSKEDIRKACQAILKRAIDDEFGAYSAVQKVKVK